MDPLDIEDTGDWLGCPTELESISHYNRMLENEIQELTLQLRKAREDIFGLVQMHAAASEQRDEAMKNLRQRSGQLATVRKQLYDLDISARAYKREADQLRGMLDGLIERPKTIV